MRVRVRVGVGVRVRVRVGVRGRGRVGVRGKGRARLREAAVGVVCALPLPLSHGVTSERRR